MKLQKRVLFWVTTVVVMVSIFATPVVALASTPRVNSNTAIYPMAVAPSLGVAQSFAVLGATAVTNVGTLTVITGDLGINPGLLTAITGFPPGTVIGGTIHGPDATTLQAQTDVTNAYNSLAGQACTQDLTGQDLGGKTLTPGVYCFTSSAGLNGILTLNMQGNADSVFVFKIGSTLITQPGAQVVTINNGGLPACNVFWQVGSSATLDTTTQFIGNILALASITMNNGANLSGRALARTGAVTFAGNSNVSVCISAPPSTTGLSIFKFNDLNGNGVQDTGELPLAGRQVTITGPGGYSSSAVTNAAGLIILSDLVPGTYIVTEIAPPGWTVITPNPQTVIVSVRTVTTVNFAERQLVGPTVGGTVMPVDKGGLLIPWLGMAVLLLLATGAVLFIRRRNSR